MPSEPPGPIRRSLFQRRFAFLSRSVLFALGCVFLVTGVAGLLLPLLPGTVFLIASAACFTRSSPRFERWLLDHPHFGPPIHRWRDRGSIPRWIKVFASASMVASWLILLETATPGLVKVACLVLFAAAIAFIATRPE